MVRTHQVFSNFWLRPVLRATAVYTFSTCQSKNAPGPAICNTFDLEMCFAPEQGTLAQHLNFQKRSATEVFCAFWLGTVLRATTARTFSTSQLPKVVWEWCVWYVLTSKFASGHNGVRLFDISTRKKLRSRCALYIFTSKFASRCSGAQLLISHLASYLRTRRFSEPTFRPSGATNLSKNTMFRDVATFLRTCIFFFLTFFSSLIRSYHFSSSLLWRHGIWWCMIIPSSLRIPQNG